MPAFGQEIPVSIDPTRGPVNTQLDFSFEENPDISLSDDLRISLQLTKYKTYFPDYWTTYANQPKVNYVYRYKGLQGLIYKHTMRSLGRYYNDALQNTWATSPLSYADLDNAQRNYALKASVPKYPWWRRPYFFNHYPIAKGGSRVEGVIIGRTHDIVTLGPLNLSNSGRVSWSGWRLTVSAEDDLPTKRFKKNNLDGTRQQETFEERRSNSRHYAFGISPPRGNLYTSDNWSVSGSVRLGLKGGFHDHNKSSITGSLRVIGFSGYKYTPWLSINIKAKAQPISQDYGVQMTISLLTF